MGKLKALVGLAPDVAKTVRRTPIGGETAPPLDFLDDLGEYTAAQKRLESQSGVTPTHGSIEQEIDRVAAAELEVKRQKAITDPSADPDTFHQTQNAEEYAIRYNEQLRNPDFMARASNPLGSGEDVGEIAKSQGRHIKMRNDMMFRLKKNTRWGARAEAWTGDSPYAGEMMFHTDRWTDPLRKDSFIQFEDPHEIGLHGGTGAASNRFVGFGSVEDVMHSRQSLSNTIDELAGLSGVPADQLNGIMAREVDNFFIQRFQPGQQMHISTDEWNSVVNKIDEEMGADMTKEMDRLIRRLRDFPTPSTTPFLFRGKNGLLLKDVDANFFPATVADQLRFIFPEDEHLIDAAMAGTRKEKTKRLQAFIEEKGFDHIVYHNGVEDKGSVSIINWNPDLQKSVYDPELVGSGGAEGSARAASAAFLGMMGIGGTGAALQSDE